MTLGDLRSVGILGGTFNPPHLGHVALAQHARDELRLERVLLMPAHTAPYKTDAEEGGQDPGPQHRMRMCELAIDAVAGVSVCPLEIERGGVSYTVDTLTSLHASHPEAELTFIVGADAASTLSSWREPELLLDLAQLAVATRAGAARQRVLEAVPRVERLRFLEMPEIEVSSSLARRRAARGESIEELVGAGVANYIVEHGLYRTVGSTTENGGVT